jgi:general secretion pathway protein D
MVRAKIKNIGNNQLGMLIFSNLFLRKVCALFVLFSMLIGMSAPALSAEKDTTSLNLKNASLRTFISTVSRATGKNFLIDPRVKGSVTVIISTPLNSKALYQVFLSILRVHNFIAVEGEHLTKILPANKSKTSSAYVSSRNPDSLVTTVVPINYINAQQIIPVLRPFVSPNSFLSAYAPTNVLIIHDTEANLNRLKRLIDAADKPINQGFEIIPVRHANAVELAKIVTTFLSKDKNTPAKQKVQLVAEVRTNRIIVKADAEQRLKIRTLISELDIEDARGNTSVIYLKYANAKQILPILQGVLGSTGADGKAKAGPVNIQADEETNAIILTASQDIVVSVKSIIRRLDIRRAQVLIQAIIAEVSSDIRDTVGVQWVSNARLNGGNTGALVGAINFDNSLPTAVLNPTQAAASIPLGAGLVVGEIQDESNNTGWGALVNLLNSNGQVNLLSAPSIVTLDNEEASILVGQEVPFITNTQLSASNTNPFQNFERKDVGLSLKVKPQINEGDAIKLEIEQEISNIIATARAADTVTSKRTLKTSVLIDDGKIIVLGGLMDEADNSSQLKVPLLGDIPLLGFFFSYNTNSSAKRNLMLFIRPQIIRDSKTLNVLSLGKYNEIRAQQLQLKEDGELAPINLNIDELTSTKTDLTPPKNQ